MRARMDIDELLRNRFGSLETLLYGRIGVVRQWLAAVAAKRR